MAFLVNSIYWLWLFIVPIILLGGAGLILYMQSEEYLPFSIILGIAGAVLGFLWAEKIRNKVGLSEFFGRLLSFPEMTQKDDSSQ